VTVPEVGVLEPQSNVLFFLLMVMFVALAWWMVSTRRLAVRLLAGGLAFLPAMVFGVMAVNRYYGYYSTWSSALADLTNQGSRRRPSCRRRTWTRAGVPPPWTAAAAPSSRRSGGGTRSGST
jgi:hypothetical protein